MEKYLSQFVAKINEVTKDPPIPLDPKLKYPDHPAMEYEGLAYIAEFEMGRNEPAEALFGIAKNEFPPSEKLNNSQMKIVLEAVEKMLLAINNQIVFPEKMPVNRRYELLFVLWDDGFQPLTEGMSYNDFCTGYAPECALKEYCFCKDDDEN